MWVRKPIFSQNAISEAPFISFTIHCLTILCYPGFAKNMALVFIDTPWSSTKNTINIDHSKYVDCITNRYRISHGLGLDIIFIQRVCVFPIS